MVIIHQLCETYHWDFETAIRRTMPQIIMLNHSAWVSKERMDRRIEADKKERKYKEDNPSIWGKSMDEMNSDEMLAYYGSSENSGWDADN